MKKNIKKLSILSLILLIISTLIILLFGRTYTFSFTPIKNSNQYTIKTENASGEIEIIKTKEKNDKCIVKVKSKKEGKAFIEIDYGSQKEIRLLYIHKSMIITYNNYFGKSTASEIIPISLSIILIYLLYLLIKKYKYEKNKNLYQYKNIAYLGIIIFLSIFTVNNIVSIFNYQGLFETINNIISSIASVSIFLFPITLITFILVTISNINLIRKEGKSLKNLLGLFLGLFLCILTILPEYTYNILMKYQIVDIHNLNSIGPYLYNFIESLIYLSVSYLECILIGTIIIAMKSIRKKVEYNKDYIIILGCKIKNDGSLTNLLKARVDKAIEFRNKQLELTGNDIVFIPSGGKGKDEITSEAEAMEKYLLKQGIKEKNIIIENKSKNTYENIKFSTKLINKKNKNICYSTTNYHVLRAGLIATEQGLYLEGIGSKTKAYFWINAFIREFIGTIYSERKKHIIVVLSMIILLIIMISITYIANNI